MKHLLHSSAPFVVVGAGISGLYAALLLARSGRSVRVLEASPKSGGLAGSELFRGLPCDLGSHRLHPAALDRPLFREMHLARPFLVRPRRGVLVLGDRHVPYPPDVLSMARSLGPRASIAMGLGLVARARRRRAFSRWETERTALPADADDVGFERFVTDRVGEAAYLAFYKPYAEKVWGIPPADLSQTVAKKRVSTTSPWRFMRGLVGRAAAIALGGDERAGDRFVYPSGGTGSIAAFLEERLSSLGVEVEYGRTFRPHAAHTGGTPDTSGGAMLFAGNLRDLVPTTLEHRGLYLIYLALPCARLRDRETYYCPDPQYWFGRVSELLNYSPDLRRPGETVLCVEIPEGVLGRGIDFSSGQRLAELLEQLAAAGIVPRGFSPLEVRQRFLPAVYPIYRRGWPALWRDAMSRVAELGNVLPFGRQALFLHCNLDHCADIAEDAVAHVSAGGTVEAWIRRAERYLTIRVRD